MFKNLQIDSLINLGFIGIITLFVILIITSEAQHSKIEANAVRLTSLRAPTAKTSASMNTNLNASLAALRGWMLIGEERFVVTRRESWQAIRQDEKKLLTLSPKWTSPENVERFSKILQLLDQLEKQQLDIELLVHKPVNVRSSKILLMSVEPLAETIEANITKMIDFSKTQKPSAERLQLLGAMADFRGSFAFSLDNIRAFLSSADEKYKISYNSHWNDNEKSYERLNALAEHLTRFEQNILKEISMLRERFTPLPEEMFNSRESDDWNRANYLLKTTAVKTSNELVTILQELVSNQHDLLEEDARNLNREVTRLEIFQIVFIGFSLLLISSFGVLISKKYRAFRQDLDSRNSLVDQNVLMATYNRKGTVRGISNALCRLLGGIKKDFVGKDCNFFLSMDKDAELHEQIMKSLMTGKAWQGEFRRETLSGEEIWLSSTIIPVNYENEGEGEGEFGMSGFHNILEDITNRKRFEEVSVTDKLTSLHNRRSYDDMMEHEIKLAKRRKTCLTLAIVDVDFFKKYNDHYGHPKGDTALVRTASVLRLSLSRPDDYAFRLGGEEFAIIFNDLDEKQSWEMLEFIRKNVEQLNIEHCQSEVSKFVTISIGAKVCSADELLDRETFYDEADRMLYAAKQSRNKVVVG